MKKSTYIELLESTKVHVVSKLRDACYLSNRLHTLLTKLEKVAHRILPLARFVAKCLGGLTATLFLKSTDVRSTTRVHVTLAPI